MTCSLFSTFSVTVQLILGMSIMGVLLIEYLVELCRLERGKSRTFVQFWLDSFKLCAGALVTHGYNVLVAYILNTSNTDECAVYTIAFYYEMTGIVVVQILQYGLVKWSRRKSLELYYKNNKVSTYWSNVWLWISTPGHYGDLTTDVFGTKSKQSEEVSVSSATETDGLLQGLLDDSSMEMLHLDISQSNISYLQTRLGSPWKRNLVIVVVILGTLGSFFFFYYLFNYELWVVVLFSFYALIMFFTLGIATQSSIYHTISWVLIKVFERSLWTLFVYIQKTQFQRYAKELAFGNSHLEAILYIAVIPFILGTVMFLMFSNIARMNIPFINLKHIFSNVMARFDLKEALQVGIYSTLLYNGILYIVAVIALLNLNALWLLLIMMILFPCVVCGIIIGCLYYLLNNDTLDKLIQNSFSQPVSQKPINNKDLSGLEIN